jgi:hypothetical protein
VLNVPNHQKYQNTEPTTNINKILSNALHNQNIIGWHEFLRGFTSKYWITAHDRTRISLNKRQPLWKFKITSIILALHKNIWDDRNIFVLYMGKQLKKHESQSSHIPPNQRNI